MSEHVSAAIPQGKVDLYVAAMKSLRSGRPFVPIEPFRYQELDLQTDQFRLMKIEPPAPGPLNTTPCATFTVHNFSMNEVPDYKAVSYMWGDNLASDRIAVNDNYLDVSENLFAFLMQWQEDSVTNASLYATWLWIDQICINQSSIRERNHQVEMMDKIFEKSTEVLTWLGAGVHDQTEKSVSIVRRASHYAGPLPEQGVVQALEVITSNQYWTRLWIIQEFVLARDLIIISGRGQVNISTLRELIRDVAALPSAQESIARIWPFFRARNSTAPSSTWVDVMYLAKKAQCRDARDRVFGMLSMVKKRVRIKVDYRATARHIRQQVVEAEIKECYDEDMNREDLLEDDEFQTFLNDLDDALGLEREGVSFTGVDNDAHAASMI